MKSYIVVLQCVTNMHVGNGDVNYNIIDNEVERDQVTGYPIINSSGVKGALREYFEKNLNASKEDIEQIFGAEGTKKSIPGKVKILSAEMAALPARASDGDKPFYMVTTKEAAERVNELSTLFIGKELYAFGQSETINNVEVEGFIPVETVKIDDREIYILHNCDFKQINLPVLARNKLENGESKNLWYEEVVPHDSLFVFPVTSNDEKVIKKFVEEIRGKVIQFGGNVSIGYGFCKVTVYE